MIFTQDNPFACGEGNSDKRAVSSHHNAAEDDDVRQNTFRGINSQPASEISSAKQEAVNRNLPDPVEEIHCQDAGGYFHKIL